MSAGMSLSLRHVGACVIAALAAASAAQAQFVTYPAGSTAVAQGGIEVTAAPVLYPIAVWPNNCPRGRDNISITPAAGTIALGPTGGTGLWSFAPQSTGIVSCINSENSATANASGQGSLQFSAGDTYVEVSGIVQLTLEAEATDNDVPPCDFKATFAVATASGKTSPVYSVSVPFTLLEDTFMYGYAALTNIGCNDAGQTCTVTYDITGSLGSVTCNGEMQKRGISANPTGGSSDEWDCCVPAGSYVLEATFHVDRSAVAGADCWDPSNSYSCGSSDAFAVHLAFESLCK